MPETHGFIGCGRVGRTLAQALAGEVPGLRALDSAQAVADSCDFLWLTVSDDAIEPVAGAIAWSPRHRVVHCSGATEVAALHRAAEAGAATGGFHPVQMFTNPAVALAGLPGCAVGIEAGPALLAELERLAAAIGCVPVRVPAGRRALYHASAYYVGPFLIALLAEAAAMWREFGADERQALDALLPLLAGTVAAVRDGGLARGMGGCYARGDVGTVRKHVAAVDGFDAAAGQLYRALGARAIPLGLARGSLSAEAADRIRQLLHGSG